MTYRKFVMEVHNKVKNIATEDAYLAESYNDTRWKHTLEFLRTNYQLSSLLEEDYSQLEEIYFNSFNETFKLLESI